MNNIRNICTLRMTTVDLPIVPPWRVSMTSVLMRFCTKSHISFDFQIPNIKTNVDTC